MASIGGVCAACFDDADIKARISAQGQEPGCYFCWGDDAPTIDFYELIEFMRERLLMFWSLAIEELFYDNESDSGFGGDTWTTEEILFEEVQLVLPRDTDGSLHAALIDALGDESWCELDPARLPPNKAMVMDWQQFAERAISDGQAVMEIVAPHGKFDDSMPPGLVLQHLASMLDRLGLVAVWPTGYKLFRARPREGGQRFTRPSELGPPPVACATQSNRMNVVGDPMFYGAERAATAVEEAAAPLLSVGLFSVERDVRMLDLADLPPAPGMFSESAADDIQALWFLHEFADLISLPVQRRGPNVPEYVPTQLMTSYLRRHTFEAGSIDGIRYRSSVTAGGDRIAVANVVLFATEADVCTEGADTETRPFLLLRATFQYPEERASLEVADGASVRASQRRVIPDEVPQEMGPLPLFTWVRDEAP